MLFIKKIGTKLADIWLTQKITMHFFSVYLQVTMLVISQSCTDTFDDQVQSPAKPSGQGLRRHVFFPGIHFHVFQWSK